MSQSEQMVSIKTNNKDNQLPALKRANSAKSSKRFNFKCKASCSVNRNTRNTLRNTRCQYINKVYELHITLHKGTKTLEKNDCVAYFNNDN